VTPLGGAVSPPTSIQLLSCKCVLINLLISILSGTLIHPTVWPEYANVTDRTDSRTIP